MAKRPIDRVVLLLLVLGAVAFVLLLAGVGADALTNAPH